MRILATWLGREVSHVMEIILMVVIVTTLRTSVLSVW